MRKYLALILFTLAITYAHNASAGLIVRAPSILGSNSGLVGYWSFNGPDIAKNTAYDRSGQGNTGTLTNGPKRVAGKLGQALSFSGGGSTSARVNITDSTSLQLEQTITISTWINASYVSPACCDEIITRVPASSNSANYAFRLRNDGKLWFTYRNSADTAWHEYGSNALTWSDGWHHVAVSFTYGTGSSMQLYRDGVAISGSWETNNGNDPVFSFTGGRVNIGYEPVATSNFLGLIDEVRVYNRALSAGEIKRLYNQGASKVQASQVDRLRDGLVGYWTFDGNDINGTRARDASGNGNLGTLTNGPKVAKGKLGQALEFDGVNDYVTVPISSIIAFPAYTWCHWFYPGVAPESDISRQNVQIGSGSDPFGFSWSNANATFRQAAYHRDSGGNYSSAKLTSTLSANIWYFICGSWDGTTLRVYLNANEEASAQVASIFNFTPPYEIFISRSTAVSKGTIDEVRIYNRALSGEEVRRLYNEGAAKLQASQVDKLRQGLVGYWSFDGPDINGTRARDASGNGNQGTLTNGPKVAKGKLGQALEFDGVDDYVDAGIISAVSNVTKATLTGWWKRDASSDKMMWGPHLQPTRFIIQPWSDGNTYVAVENGVGATYSSVAYSTLGWHYFALVYDGTQATDATKAILYIDGIQQTLAAWTLPVPTSLGFSSFRIGMSRDGADRFGNNAIDEVRVYNRALSSDEIKRLYNMGR